MILGRLDRHNRWPACQKYGFVSAGGGAHWWKPLQNLKPGHRVFAYVGGAGYVGVGEVTGEMKPLKDLRIMDGGNAGQLVVQQPDLPEFMLEAALRRRPGAHRVRSSGAVARSTDYR